jgi:hypothetical protein
MQYQELRAVLFLITNGLVCFGFILVAAVSVASLRAFQDDRGRWAALLLIYFSVQIFVRFLVIVVFAIFRKKATGETTVYADDEMDKSIDLQATKAAFHAFMICLALALVTQVVGMPVRALFLGLGAGAIASGLVGDGCSIYYRRRGL